MPKLLWLAVACGWLLAFPATVPAQSPGAGPLLKLLQSGRLPPARQPAVVEMVCKKGNADDLAFVYQQTLRPDGFAAPLRLKALGWLADAARINKVQPSGDLASVRELLADPQAAADPAFALATIRLAAVWQVAEIGPELQRLALNAGTPDKLRTAALEGLVTLGGDASRETLAQLAAPDQAINTRMQAAALLAQLDLPAAAQAAAAALTDATPDDDPTKLIEAFLTRSNGADVLAATLGNAKLPPDVAKRALRAMYAAGRSDSALSDVLSHAAGIAVDPPPPTLEELQAIYAQVQSLGDAARGELVFRRNDVNCMKCHAVSGGGGTVGPDLSALGSTSPVDYVVNSILNPNLAVKEQYVTKIINTVDGQTITGIVVDRNDQQVQLKDANSQIITIPTADIDEEGEGRSLMPQGLTKFLTQQEFLDLARFVSELGKPGPYAIRTRPVVQRWRVLREPTEQLLTEVPNIEFLRELVLSAPTEAWLPAYGKVAGALPLEELRAATGQDVVYLQTDVEVTTAGPVGLRLNSTETLTGWLDVTPFDAGQELVTPLTPGTHTLTLRIHLPDSPGDLTAEFFTPENSSATIVVR